jgi:23S rRNA pseudouridine1911/1915/1917 synthase
MPPRTFIVARREARQSVAAVLHARLAVSRAEARRLVRSGWVRLGGAPCTDPERRVAAGQRLEVREPTAARPRPAGRAGAGPVVRFADAHVVVVDKPAGLTTMRHPEEAAEFGARARRFLPPTLADLLPGLLGEGRPRVIAVHRLDKDTSGLVVFARTPAAARHLGRQFREHTVDRTYLALVRGRAAPGTITSHLVRDRGDGRRGSGSGTQPGAGERAVTHVRVVEELGAYTLIECRLETGRTHQIRIHLGEAGTPLCGERVYDRPPHGRPLPDDSGAERVALHAATLGFVHPATGKPMTWTSPLSKDMQRLVDRLRKQARAGD